MQACYCNQPPKRDFNKHEAALFRSELTSLHLASHITVAHLLYTHAWNVICRSLLNNEPIIFAGLKEINFIR